MNNDIARGIEKKIACGYFRDDLGPCLSDWDEMTLKQ